MIARLAARLGLARARRVIAVHHRLAGRTGHRFHEGLGLMAEAPRRGLTPVLLIHRDAEPEVRAALPSARAVLHDPVFRTDLSFPERVSEFTAMLDAHLEPELAGDDLVLVTVATQCEAGALAAWLGARPRERPPRVVLFFHSDRWNRHGEVERARQAAEFASVARALAALDPGSRLRLRMGAATGGLARELSGLLAFPVEAAPQPMTYGAIPSAPSVGPPRIGILGGARPEKGSRRVPELVRALRERTGGTVLLHLANEQMNAEEWSALEALGGVAGVEVLRGALSAGEWARALASCHLFVFPYDRLPYRQRASGIFAEAIAAGRPVVVPDGTWMSEQIDAGRAAGVTYEGADPGAIADAVSAAIARLPDLAARAAALAPAWRARHSLAAFLRWADRPRPV